MGYDNYYDGGLLFNGEPNDKVKQFFKTNGVSGGRVAIPWRIDKNGDDWLLVRNSPDKRNDPDEGLKCIIEDILKPNGLILNGTIFWEGDERDDIGKIVVKDNVIFVFYGHIVYKDAHGNPESELEIERVCSANGQ